MGDRTTGYDQTRDPRTGRPPLASDAERIRQERIRQAEGQDPASEGHEGAPDQHQALDASEDTVTVEGTDELVEDTSSDDDDDEVAVEIAVDDLEFTEDQDKR